VQPDSEDDAWRAIVENYGDRAELDDEPPPPASSSPAPGGVEDDWRTPEPPPEPAVAPAEDDERYVPPPPPPLPHVAPDRLVAWTGVFGSPTVLLVALLVGVHLPAWLGYLLVVGFVGGFVYLVAHMSREPRDPGDDGARL
jgi:hypothetical protein